MQKWDKRKFIHIMFNILSILVIIMTLILGTIGILSEIERIMISGKTLTILFISYVYLIGIEIILLFSTIKK